ncbi:hypothetical protein KP509_14G043100 [Ceratopteris richardii]|uniref:Uncharacterized protein n=1 Tax=Ceratopteris richardii TaxID=49495 RepID=A0A8T2T9S3_CERRI|nr:hypothetical protein KP509_14G043100 [Ceratopteris richardii]
MAIAVSPASSLAQPALRGRFSCLYIPSPLTRRIGFRLDRCSTLHASRNIDISCKQKPSSVEISSDSCSRTNEKSSRQRSRKHQLRHQSLARYRSRFTSALEAELNAEQNEIRERLKKWSKHKLEAEGVAIFDLYAQSEGRLYRDKLLKLYTRSGDGLLPAHNQFSQGDIVVMSRNHPLAEDESVLEGVVVERARRFLKLAVPFNQCKDINLMKRWRLDLYANRTAYERCMFAIDIFSSPLVHQHGGILRLESSQNMRKSAPGWPLEDGFRFGEGASAIRGLVMKFHEVQLHVSPEYEGYLDEGESGTSNSPWVPKLLEELKALKSPPSRIGGKNLGDAKNHIRTYLKRLGRNLNTSQKVAIETAAIQKVTIWQGPPGTGKTKTLTYLVAALCDRGERVLACADSNVAVDNLVEGFLALGLRVARVGQPVKVKEELRECTVDAQVANHPLMKNAFEKKNKSMQQMRLARHINNEKQRSDGVRGSKLLWEKAQLLEAKAIEDVLNRADVVACTCIGAGDEVLLNVSFTVCVIDEATQATEPASLLPILKSGADAIVLVGDPVQLPPTVLSSEAMMAGLDFSLYQQLQQCGLNPCFLDTQYRMHPEIAKLPSKLFYFGRLLSYPSHSDRLPPSGYPWPNSFKPMVFIDCLSGREETTPESSSCFNNVEATQVLEVLKQLKSGSDFNNWKDVGVIAPYSAQVRLLKDMLMVDKYDEFQNLEIKTVDGFQGREKEVIIFCTVRANEKSELGFVSDPRRMNVALTRARRGLVVVGNSKTLESDKNWANWLVYMKKQKLYHAV